MATSLIAVAGVLVASVVGGMTGFASALLTTPVLLLTGFRVDEVVVVNLLAGLVTRIGVLIATRHIVGWRLVATIVAASAPGALVGALTVPYLDDRVLRTAAGVVVCVLGALLLVATSGTGRPPGRTAAAFAGFAGGYLSTSISLNGPPIALLLARGRPEPTRFVADLAGYVVGTNLIALLILGVNGQIPGSVLSPTLPLLLASAIVGNAIGFRLTRLVPARPFRFVVIGLVIVSGVVTAIT